MQHAVGQHDAVGGSRRQYLGRHQRRNRAARRRPLRRRPRRPEARTRISAACSRIARATSGSASNSGLNRYRDDIFTRLRQERRAAQRRAEHGLPGPHGPHLGGLSRCRPDAVRARRQSRLHHARRPAQQRDLLHPRGARRRSAGRRARRAWCACTTAASPPTCRPTRWRGCTVFDALEDSRGRVWLATPGGLGRNCAASAFQIVVPGAPHARQRRGRAVRGPRRRHLGRHLRQGTVAGEGRRDAPVHTADGCPAIRSARSTQDPDGTLWIGTFGGGLNALRDGKFHQLHGAGRPAERQHRAHVADDGESLWLSTTRGICRIAKQQLARFRRRTSAQRLEPVNYGVEDGLRSAQCAPELSRPAAAANRTADGRLWFTTSRGLAVLDPNARNQQPCSPPLVHLVEYDGQRRSGGSQPAGATARPATSRVQIRYTGIHLSAPERVRYSYKLEGLDPDWVRPATRRVINYNSLPHGHYRFVVRAELPGGPASERSYRVRSAAALLRDVVVPLPVRGAAAGGGMGRLPVAAAADPLAGSRWCWRSARAWRARFTTRWRRASSASRRSWTRWPCACRKRPTPARTLSGPGAHAWRGTA